MSLVLSQTHHIVYILIYLYLSFLCLGEVLVNHYSRRLVFVSHVLMKIQMSVCDYVLLQQNLKPPKCPPVSADTPLTQELTAAVASRMEEVAAAAARCFLESFVTEFPAPLEEDSPLPVSPLSRRVSLEELHGESLEMGQKLLAGRYRLGEENTFI